MPDSQTTIVCSGCLAVNKMPQSRLVAEPVCGNCKTSLVPNRPIELNDENFQKFVSRTSLPVMVDFWADWCGPCKRMAPEFSAAAATLAPNIILAKLNTELARQTASRFDISGIPCLIAFAGGKETQRQAGVMSRDQIVSWARSIRV
jgi:thioredoxin 2